MDISPYRNCVREFLEYCKYLAVVDIEMGLDMIETHMLLLTSKSTDFICELKSSLTIDEMLKYSNALADVAHRFRLNFDKYWMLNHVYLMVDRVRKLENYKTLTNFLQTTFCDSSAALTAEGINLIPKIVESFEGINDDIMDIKYGLIGKYNEEHINRSLIRLNPEEKESFERGISDIKFEIPAELTVEDFTSNWSTLHLKAKKVIKGDDNHVPDAVCAKCKIVVDCQVGYNLFTRCNHCVCNDRCSVILRSTSNA